MNNDQRMKSKPGKPSLQIQTGVFVSTIQTRWLCSVDTRSASLSPLPEVASLAPGR